MRRPSAGTCVCTEQGTQLQPIVAAKNGRRARVPPPRCHRQHSPKVFDVEMSSRVVSNVDALVDGQGQ